MNYNKKTVKDIDIKGKKVLLRCDFNVPMAKDGSGVITDDKRIRAAAIGAGLADCFTMYRTREDSMKQVFHELVGGSPEEKPEAFQARSAVCWPEKIIPPILICQGTDDWRVVPQQAYDMDAALSKANKVHKLIVYPGADHSLKGTSYIVIAWLQSYPL